MNFNNKITDKFIDKFIKNKDTDPKVKRLMSIPPKEKGKQRPKLRAFTPNVTHQMDILYMPNDKGYKYALVIVDVNTRLADAEALKTHSSGEVVKAIEKIYGRKILTLPKMFINVDNGSEFKGEFTKWAKSKKLAVRIGMTNRHRQQALVEYVNLIIGRGLFIRMNAEEIQNSKETIGWKKYLKDVIEIYNEHIKETYRPLTTSTIFKTSMPILPDSFNDILQEGTMVRTIKNYPDNLYKKRVDSKFRNGDIRYNVEPEPITKIILEPLQPILYQVGDNNKVAYTRQQLQIIDNIEPVQMEAKFMDDERYNVERIVDKRKKGRTYEYLIKFEDYDETYNEWKTLPKIKEEGLYDFVKKYEDK